MTRLFACLFALLLSLPLLAQQPLSGTAFTSAVRTAAQVNSADIANTQWRGAQFVINVSAFTSGTYTPKVQGKDSISGNYYDILTGTALGATGTTTLTVYPGVTAAANVAAAQVLPRTFRVQLNGASTPSMTLSVSFTLVP